MSFARSWLRWAGLGLAAAWLATPSLALAHERREVGPYSLLVGFNTEPALQGEPNGAQLTVTVPGENNRPVEGLADSVRVQVGFGGGQPREFRLRPVFGQPGRYVADFVPTRAGTYIFTFTGSIEGLAINERFESGPGRFNDVEAVADLQFPEPVPPANEAVRQARAAAERVEEVEGTIGQVRLLALGGLGLGLVALVLAGVGLAQAAARKSAP